MTHAAQFTDATIARAAMLAGNATMTLVSKKTGTRYTFKVRAAKDGKLHFVSLLTGSNNENDFSYIGIIPQDKRFRTTAKTAAPESAPVKGFGWAFSKLAAGEMPEALEVWHEGKCCKCGRKLTVPSSVASGIGPECAAKMAGGGA